MTKRSKQNSYGTKAEQIDTVVKHLRKGKPANLHILFGPVVWLPEGDRRKWYFVTISDEDGVPQIDEICGYEKELMVEFRAGIIGALVQERPIVMHDFDDELEMAKWAESIWPVPKIQNIRASIEAERRIE